MKTRLAVNRTDYGIEKEVKQAIKLLGGIDTFIDSGA